MPFCGFITTVIKTCLPLADRHIAACVSWRPHPNLLESRSPHPGFNNRVPSVSLPSISIPSLCARLCLASQTTAKLAWSVSGCRCHRYMDYETLGTLLSKLGWDERGRWWHGKIFCTHSSLYCPHPHPRLSCLHSVISFCPPLHPYPLALHIIFLHLVFCVFLCVSRQGIL